MEQIEQEQEFKLELQIFIKSNDVQQMMDLLDSLAIGAQEFFNKFGFNVQGIVGNVGIRVPEETIKKQQEQEIPDFQLN